MAEETKIQWCDHTFNPWIGCAKVSPGCANCYAEVSTPSRALGVKWGKGQPRQRTGASNWKEPVRWNNSGVCIQCGHSQSRRTKEPHPNPSGGWCGGPDGSGHIVQTFRRPRVFCASLADWLDEEVPVEWLADLLKLILDTPNLDWLLLTKRPENWRARINQVAEGDATKGTDQEWADGWEVRELARRMVDHDHELPNVWIGTTVEDQQRAEERIPALLKIPARVRFLSVEPLLGPVDLDLVEDGRDSEHEKSWAKPTDRGCGIDWVIVGGESGSKARPCNVDWIRSVARQCKAAGVPCFVKQLGADVRDEWPNPKGWPLSVLFNSHVLTRAMLKHPKGGDPDEWPEDLRVREFPQVNQGSTEFRPTE